MKGMDHTKTIETTFSNIPDAISEGKSIVLKMMWEAFEPYVLFAGNGLTAFICAALAFALLQRCATELHDRNVPGILLSGFGSLIAIYFAYTSGLYAFEHPSLLGFMVMGFIVVTIFKIVTDPFGFFERLARGALRQAVRDSF